MAMLLPSGSVWSAKHYIVAVLVGVLFAVALAAVVSIALAPARISFCVADPGMAVLQVEEAGEQARKVPYYRFTLIANNPSRRMSVSYGGYLYTQIWPQGMAWIPGHVSQQLQEWRRLQEWQPPGAPPIKATILAESWQLFDEQDEPVENVIVPSLGQTTVDGANLTMIVVKAEVRFKLGLVPTMPYTITVTCMNVNFNNTNYTVECRPSSS